MHHTSAHTQVLLLKVHPYFLKLSWWIAASRKFLIATFASTLLWYGMSKWLSFFAKPHGCESGGTASL